MGNDITDDANSVFTLHVPSLLTFEIVVAIHEDPSDEIFDIPLDDDPRTEPISIMSSELNIFNVSKPLLHLTLIGPTSLETV